MRKYYVCNIFLHLLVRKVVRFFVEIILNWWCQCIISRKMIIYEPIQNNRNIPWNACYSMWNWIKIKMWNFKNVFLHNRATKTQLFIKQNLSVYRIQAIFLLWSLLMSFKTLILQYDKKKFTYCINCLYIIFDMLTGHLVMFVSFIYCHARLHFDPRHQLEQFINKMIPLLFLLIF